MLHTQRTAFVTGANGFLGVNLVEQLMAGKWRVIALHRRQSDLTYLKRFPVVLVEGSIEDRESLEQALPEGIDVLFHVAADVSFWSRNNDRQTRTNVDGTRHVVAAALKKGVKKLVCTSTTSVYGFQTAPFDESAAHLGRGSWFNYMHTKALAEEEVRLGIERGLDATFLNPANIVGPYDRNNWSRLIRLAADNKLPSIPPGGGTFCHVKEVARAHISAVEKGRRGENYIVGGADASYAAAIGIVAELVGKKVTARIVSPILMRFAGRVMGWISNISGKEPIVTPEIAAFMSANITCKSDKAIRELDYRPVPLRDMFADCHKWMVAEELLPAAAISA